MVLVKKEKKLVYGVIIIGFSSVLTSFFFVKNLLYFNLTFSGIL
jgi:hypothetical protein